MCWVYHFNTHVTFRWSTFRWSGLHLSTTSYKIMSNISGFYCVKSQRERESGVERERGLVTRDVSSSNTPAAQQGNCQGLSDQSTLISHFPPITSAERVKWAANTKTLKTRMCSCDLWPLFSHRVCLSVTCSLTSTVIQRWSKMIKVSKWHFCIAVHIVIIYLNMYCH